MFEDMIYRMRKYFFVEVPLEREVEQCIFYRVNLPEDIYDEWKCSMQKMLFSKEAIDKATVIIQENQEKLGETK